MPYRDAEKTIEIEQPDDWDLWYSGGSDLHVRILGREKRTLTLASREEKSVEVPQPQIGTDGLPRGTYKVRSSPRQVCSALNSTGQKS